MITNAPDLTTPRAEFNRETTTKSVPRPAWSGPLGHSARAAFPVGPYRVAIGCSVLSLPGDRTRTAQN